MSTISTAEADSYVADAKEVYLAVQELALDIEKELAGPKLAKDKAKSFNT